jgi:hypothetical protein
MRRERKLMAADKIKIKWGWEKKRKYSILRCVCVCVRAPVCVYRFFLLFLIPRCFSY